MIQKNKKLCSIGALLFGVAIVCGPCSEGSALTYNSETKTTSSTGSIENGAATVTIGVKLEESGGITGATWQSVAPNVNGTYSAGEIGTISFTYSANATGTVTLAPSHEYLANGDAHIQYAIGSANGTAGSSYTMNVAATANGATSDEQTVNVYAKTDITQVGEYSDTVTITFVPSGTTKEVAPLDVGDMFDF